MKDFISLIIWMLIGISFGVIMHKVAGYIGKSFQFKEKICYLWKLFIKLFKKHEV